MTAAMAGALGALVLAGTAGPAAAATRPTVEISSIGTARLVDGGAAIDVPVTVTCTTGSAIAVESTTEAFVQEGSRGHHLDAVWGEAYGQPPVCDGSPHVRVVRVAAESGGTWHVGWATVEAQANINYQVEPGVWELAYDEVTAKVKVRR